MKPLEPLKWQPPYEPSQLERVASVIDKIVMAREAVANSYRYPATKAQYEALAKFNQLDWSGVIVTLRKPDDPIFNDDPDYGPQNFFEP